MKYTIEQDDYPGDDGPRDWDNLGTMVCWHTRYDLGDKTLSHDNLQEQVNDILSEDCFVLPLHLYDHSGLSMSTSNSGYPFSDIWDSGQVGFIYVTKADVRKEWNKQRISKQLENRVYDNLRAEVNEYDQFLRGDVWGYTITDRHGDIVDSCWGFYGYDYCEQEAQAQMKYFQQQEDKELIELQSVVR